MPDALLQAFMPGSCILAAAQDMAQVASDLGLSAFGSTLAECRDVVPLMWAAAADSHSHPLLDWLGLVLDAAMELRGRTSADALSSVQLRTSWLSLRRYLRGIGIHDRGDFSWIFLDLFWGLEAEGRKVC